MECIGDSGACDPSVDTFPAPQHERERHSCHRQESLPEQGQSKLSTTLPLRDSIKGSKRKRLLTECPPCARRYALMCKLHVYFIHVILAAIPGGGSSHLFFTF